MPTQIATKRFAVFVKIDDFRARIAGVRNIEPLLTTSAGMESLEARQGRPLPVPSFIFFCWCVWLRASPATPPCRSPSRVLARTTSGSALVFHNGGFVGVVNLAGVVSAAGVQIADLLVGHIFHKPRGFRIAAKKNS